MKKFLKISALVLGILLLLLVALSLSLPYLVNLSAIKDRVARRLSHTLRAEVSVKTLRLKVFLRPGLSAEGVRIKAPRYLLTVKSLKLYPEILPLFHRQVLVRDFSLEAPQLKVYLSRGGKPFRWQEFLKKIPPLPTLSARLSQGQIQVFREEVLLLDLSDLAAEVSTQPEQVLLEASARAPFLERIQLKARLNTREPGLEGRLEASHVDLSRFRWPGLTWPLPLEKTDLSLSVAYTYEEGGLVAGFLLTAPCVKPEGLRLISCAKLEGQLTYGPANWEILLKDFDFREPLFRGEGRLAWEKGFYSLDLKAEEVDFSGLRERLLPFSEKSRGLSRFLARVKGGRFEEVDLKARARSLSACFRPENLILSARVREGALSLSRPRLEVSGARGILSLVAGDLTFKGAARLRKTRISSAAVRVHLKDRKAPLSVKARFEGEAAELLPVARSASKKVQKALAGLEAAGPLAGEVLISGTRAAPRVSLSLRPKGVLVKDPRLPFPLKASGGIFRFSGKRVSLSGLSLSGSFGEVVTSLSYDFSVRPARIEIREARGRLKFPALQPLFLRFSSARRLLETYRLSLSEVDLEALSFKGPLSGKALRSGLILSARLASGALYLPSLDLSASFSGLPVRYQKETLGFGPGSFVLKESRLQLSGDLDLAGGGLSLRGSGTLSSALLEHFYRRYKVDPRFRLKAPLEVHRFELSRRDQGLTAAFSAVSSGGALLEGRLLRAPGLFQLQEGHLAYAGEDLHFSYEKTPEGFRTILKGRLSGKTLAALFVKNPGLSGDFQADLQLDFRTEHPLLSRFEGRLSGGPLQVPYNGWPEIEHFALRGRGRSLEVSDLKGRLGASDFKLSGQLEVAPRNFRFEARLISRHLDLSDLRKRLKKEKSSSRGPVFVGHATFSVADLRLGPKYGLSRVEGELFYRPGRGRVVLKRGTFCDLPLRGEYLFGKAKALELSVLKSQGEFERLLTCLSPEKEALIRGSYRLRAEVRFSGTRSLFESGEGEILLVSPSGRIERFGLLAKLLGFLSPIDLFRGQVPSLEEEGFPYQGLSVKARLEGPKIHVQDAHLEGPGLRLFASGDIYLPNGRLDLTVMASPFKTVDTITSNIPLVGFLLTGKDKMLVSFPVGVRGTYRDPKFVPLDPKAIGQEIFGLFKRVFQLPAQIVTPK
ncbi:AsmA family protein [Thermosulfurimonas marina]|uniref:AsmA family protein n=1 Tax=Thermosulfurimonas marina TaxID=2047767 RepID=A0A6H1WQH7_9BACT|nr:AsmA-like C-terminal domain-containing protein [Thermosulfurimonas marina]QJA05452.1 AsmA family protein [Thermosulfurimonas marina]